ncbi:MAG: hypothetical protein IIC82_07760, partial [Chloroflexi bacterium]|nr:hypothetical protein [Chloroflexota bacterium]
DGLGISYSDIATGKFYPSLVYKSAEAAKKSGRRGAQDFEGLLWGELFSPLGLPSNDTRVLLRAFSVAEVLSMAAGTHHLSGLKDMSRLLTLPKKPIRPAVSDYRVADTPLARLVSQAINERFTSVAQAARSSGINRATLKFVIYGPSQFHFDQTWTGLSTLTGIPVARLKALHAGEPLEAITETTTEEVTT